MNFWKKNKSFLLVLAILLFLVLPLSIIAKETKKRKEYRSKAIEEEKTCQIVNISADWCGGEKSYCEANGLYTPCQTEKGGINIGQAKCPASYHCCDPTAPTPTPLPPQERPTCHDICGGNQASCGAPTNLTGHKCTVVSTHQGDTADCSPICYCSVCYPLPTPTSGVQPTGSIPPSSSWPTCQQLLLNWQKTLENDPLRIAPGASIKVAYAATNSTYAKLAIRPKGAPVSENVHYDIQNGGIFSAPNTAGSYHITLNIYDREACNVLCSGGGVWYTAKAPGKCLDANNWVDKGLGCGGCQGWLEVGNNF